MEQRRDNMKTVLAECLRELMLKNLFEKITIKQISDAAGVIRVTFYNYFDDKYDCLNYIAEQDLAAPFREDGLRVGTDQAVERVLRTVQENRAFYQAAYRVTGQNSFEEMVTQNLTKVFEEYLSIHRKRGFMEQYPDALLAMYYAHSFSFHIRRFAFIKNGEETVESMNQTIHDLTRTPISGFIE